MSIQPPPTENVPIYNDANFNINSTALTIGIADTRYLQLTGGNESGLVTFAAGLSTNNVYNGTFVGTMPNGSADTGVFITNASTPTYSGINTFTNAVRLEGAGNISESLAGVYVSPLTTTNPNSPQLFFSIFDIPSVSGAGTVTTSSTIWVNGSPLAIGGGSITNSYSYYAASGISKFTDGIITNNVQITNSSDATKILNIQSLNSTGITTNLVSLSTMNQTLYLPAPGYSSDVIMSSLSPASVQNKLFYTGNLNYFINNASTSFFRFDLESLTSGVTLTLYSGSQTVNSNITFPVSANDTLSGLGINQTFTGANIFSNSGGLVIQNPAYTSSTLTLKSIGGGIYDTTLIGQSANNNLTLYLPSVVTLNSGLSDFLLSQTSTNQLLNKTLITGTQPCIFADYSDSSKILAIDLSGATTSSTMTLACIQSTNRTLTLPNLTDNLVSRTSTDTLTNKTLQSGTNTCYWADSADSTKQLKINLTGNTSGAITTLIFNSSATDSITFPNPGGGNLTVGTTTSTQSLTNKSFNTSSCLFTDNSDSTKKVGFSCSGNTTGITGTLSFACTSARTYSFPDVASDTVALLAATQTLTSKTIAFPTSGGTPTNLSYYEELSITLAKSNWSSTTLTFTLCRIGSMVILRADQYNLGSAATLASTLQFQTSGGSTTLIPTRFCPATSDCYFTVWPYYITGTTACILQITTAGLVTVGLSNGNPIGNFTASQDFNLFAFSVSWNVI